MARHRRTFALILVSLSILVPVIVAFRVHLPKTTDKVEVKKCDDCDGNDLRYNKLRSGEIKSAKLSYEELKKSVREKQKTQNQKPLVNNNEDDEDSDEESDVIKTVLKNDKKIVNKVSGVLESKNKKFFTVEIDDDDDDDDDEVVSSRIKLYKNKKTSETFDGSEKLKKINLGIKSKLQSAILKSDKVTDSDDESTDDDNNNSGLNNNSRKNQNVGLHKSEIKYSSTHTTSSSTQKISTDANSYDDEDSDDEDDDDDDDHDIEPHTNFVKQTSKETTSHEKKSFISVASREKTKKIIAYWDNDKDDDDNDDYNNDDDDFKNNNDKVSTKFNKQMNEKKVLQERKTSSSEERKAITKKNVTPLIYDEDNGKVSTKLDKQKKEKPLSGEKKSLSSDDRMTTIKTELAEQDHNDESDDYDDSSNILSIQDKQTKDITSSSEKKPMSSNERMAKIKDKLSNLDKGDGEDNDDDDDRQLQHRSEQETHKLAKSKEHKEINISKQKDIKKPVNINKTKEIKSTQTPKTDAISISVLPKKAFITLGDSDDDDEDDDDDDDDEITIKKTKLAKVNKTSAKNTDIDLKREKVNKKIESKEQSKTEKKKETIESKNVKAKYDEETSKAKKLHLKDEKESKQDLKSLKKEDKDEKGKSQKKPDKYNQESNHKVSQEKPHIPESIYDSRENLDKTEIYIKQVTEALHRRNLLQSEFEDFYSFFPTFAPNFSRIHNQECRRQGQIVLRQLRGTKLWALNMLDATAKIPSGILQGNGIQLGDFDQCLGSRARVQLDTGSVVKVQGKYCLVQIDVKAEHPELEVPVHLAQAKNLIKSRIDDPGHFVPRFSTLSWGVCVPEACGPEDVEVVMKDALKHYQHVTGLVVRLNVDEDDCHTHKELDWGEWLELPTLFTISLYIVVLLLVLLATILDFLSRRKPDTDVDEDSDEKAECDQKEESEVEKKSQGQGGALRAFSLYYTVSKLTAPGTDEDITCIHGIRGIATLALLVAHKFLPIAITPFTNRLKVTETASSPLWSWCRAGWMYTDCFLLLSGTLTAHRMCIDTDTPAPKRIISRFLRLTPALLAVVLFYAYVWDNISTGPLWGTLVTKNAEICQQGWWWNLLYVQNYFGLEEMCAPQTHQLALDMQLTMIGCFIVWITRLKPKWALVYMPAVHLLTAYNRYSTAKDHRLTMLAYHGVSLSQLYRTARLSYTSTIHRSTPYLIGVSLGLALQKQRDHNKLVLILGWLTSITLWSLVWWAGLDAGSTHYKYDVTFAAQYAALAPMASALAVAWVIYAVQNGSSEFLSSVLCCRFLVLISRLSYAMYLCQFIIFLTNAAIIRGSSEFTLLSLVDLQEISAIILASTVLTLTFVIPMQSIPKVFSFSSLQGSKEKEDENLDLNEQVEQSEKRQSLPKIEEVEETEENDLMSNFVAHREIPEEITDAELEFEMLREAGGLEEILEEEEDEEQLIGEADDEAQLLNEEDEQPIEEADDETEPNDDEAADEEDEIRNDEELEVIEEEQGGEDDFWADRDDFYRPRRSFENQDEDDIEEWELTNGSSRYGAQHYWNSR